MNRRRKGAALILAVVLVLTGCILTGQEVYAWHADAGYGHCGR